MSGAFEGIVIAGLLMVSIAVVSTMQGPPPSVPHVTVQRDLEQAVDDLLRALETSPDPSRNYPSLLQRYIVESSNGNATGFFHYVQRALPPGTQVRLMLQPQAGLSSRVLAGDQTPSPRQEAVSRTLQWVPLDHGALLVPQFDVLDGQAMALPLTLIPLQNGFATQPDIPLDVDVENATGAHYHATASVVLGTGSQVTMSLVEDGRETNYYGFSDRTADQFVLRLNHTGGAALAPGARLVVRLPPSWSNVADAESSASWRDLNTTEGQDGWTIRAVLNTTLAQGTLDFHFNGTRPDSGSPSAMPFDLGLATLNDGLIASGPLLFKGNPHTTNLAAPVTKGVLVSAPIQLGQTSRLTILFANPQPDRSVLDIDNNCLAFCETIRHITIRQPQGIGVFDNVSTSPWQRIDNVTLEWRGSLTLLDDQVAQLQVNITPLAKTLGKIVPRTAKVNFTDNRYVENLTSVLPGNAYQARVSPNTNTNGYPRSAPPPGRLDTFTACAQAGLDKGPVSQACANYKISSLVSLINLTNNFAGGALGSSLNLTYTPPQAGFSLSGMLSLHANFTALDEAVRGPDLLGAVNTTLTIYHPWTLQPYWATTTTSADSTYTITLPSNPTYGTYVAVAERNVDLVGGNPVDQTVRLTATATVGESPTQDTDHISYHVLLQAWLPDW